MHADRQWTIEKKVPVALLIALAIQTGVAFWWAASTSERINTLERQSALYSAAAPLQADRLTRMEVQIGSVKESMVEIKNDIKSLVRRDLTPTRPN